MNTDAWQAVGLALSTFVQEDVPTIGAALLASAGQLDWRVAFGACFAGIWVGDALLYLLARGAGRPLLATRLAQRFVKAEALARGEQWFAERGTWALVLSRFVPGLRLPTYLAAGFLRVSFPKFLLVTGAAVLVWTAALFAGAHWLGARVQSVVENSGVALALAGGVMLLGIVAWRKGAQPSGFFFTHKLGDARRSPSPRPSPAGRGRNASSLPASRCIHYFRTLADWLPLPAGEGRGEGERRVLSQSWFKRKPSRRISACISVWFTRWTRWEFWPAWLFYFPVAVNYVRLALKYRGFTLPTAANPGLFSGGFVGESKVATLRDLHATSPEFTAEARLLDGVTPTERLGSLQRHVAEQQLNYPFILKPDVGQRGVGVKLIRTTEQAADYLHQTDAPLIVQRYAPGPGEAGVFYYRFPGQPRGRIFAITEKIFPTITGDGRRTMEELIWADERARFMAGKYFQRLGERRSEVLPAGETVKLVEAGNHAQGCIFRDGSHLWSQELERRMDEISRRLDGFFIGRYDLRYVSDEDLRAGKNFQIIELNGAASEATNIYDARNSLRSAYRTLFRQWELVFAIGAANRERGASPTKLTLLWRAWRTTSALSVTYPPAD